jgi:hypothetical protein
MTLALRAKGGGLRLPSLRLDGIPLLHEEGVQLGNPLENPAQFAAIEPPVPTQADGIEPHFRSPITSNDVYVRRFTPLIEEHLEREVPLAIYLW